MLPKKTIEQGTNFEQGKAIEQGTSFDLFQFSCLLIISKPVQMDPVCLSLLIGAIGLIGSVSVADVNGGVCDFSAYAVLAV